MVANTRIEWADHTFNAWIGCTKVSKACDHCYAEDWAKRYRPNDGLWSGNLQRTSTGNWDGPRIWNQGAQSFRKKHGRYPMVFCSSLSDVFDNQAPDEWRVDLWRLIESTPYLTWMLLTKRPQNIRKMLPFTWGAGWPNVWLGTTVEDQDEANRRIPHLLSVPAAKRFLSCEPLLSAIDISSIWYDGGSLPKNMQANDEDGCTLYPLRGESTWPACHYISPSIVSRHTIEDGQLWTAEGVHSKIDWVIAGGESGPKARPSHPDWFRSLRDQCAAADVPFLFKQWGEWGIGDAGAGMFSVTRSADQSNHSAAFKAAIEANLGDPASGVMRIGKAKAGRMLDGVFHDDIPGDAR